MIGKEESMEVRILRDKQHKGIREIARITGLLHHAHVIQIRGDSYRLKEKRRSGILGQQLTTVQIDD